MAKIRLGIVGGGLFTRDAHIPALKALDDLFEVVAVCSRTADSAQARADEFAYPVEAMTDIDALLAREDIDAVTLVLPIHLLPEMTAKALESDKHIISEKPVAMNVAQGRGLLERYTGANVWMVAENFRYHDTFVQAAEMLQAGEIGRPLLANWTVHIPFKPGNKYYHTAWRTDGSFTGGIFLDGGVHHVATLRCILGEVTRVSALATAERDDLPGVTTISANMQFENGTVANFSTTFSAPGEWWASPLVICGTEGVMHVDFEKIEVTRGQETRILRFGAINNVRNELEAFAAAIQQGELHRNPPEEAVQDVAIIEAALRSAETGQAVTPERIV